MSAKLYFLTLSVFFAIDMIWLGLIAKQFYAQQLGSLLKTDVNWLAALVFYALFVVGLVVLILQPALDKSSLQQALLHAALFGLITYATYDLTNLATLKNWPILVSIVDLIWGTTLSASVVGISYVISKKIGL